MMRATRLCLMILMQALLLAPAARADLKEMPTGAFEVVHETVVPGTPEAAWDELTGDVSGWWDHNQSGDPYRLVIDARPGGLFYEHFDESGENGAVHATVIYADRGRKLIFEGPLGFAGTPLDLVTTWELAPVGVDRTRVTVTCRGMGLLPEGAADAVDRVWHHFLIERFQVWMEGLSHGG